MFHDYTGPPGQFAQRRIHKPVVRTACDVRRSIRDAHKTSGGYTDHHGIRRKNREVTVYSIPTGGYVFV